MAMKRRRSQAHEGAVEDPGESRGCEGRLWCGGKVVSNGADGCGERGGLIGLGL